MICRTAKQEKVVNLWIDIFPLDGLPENKIRRKLHCLRLLILRGEFKLSMYDKIVDYRNKNRPWYENAVMWLQEHTGFGKLFHSQRLLHRIDRVLSKYDFYDSTYVMNFMGSYKLKSVMNRKEIYAEGAEYEFEGRKFHGPKDYDRYLHQIYGDYMKLPPVDQRNWHQTEIYQKTANKPVSKQ